MGRSGESPGTVLRWDGDRGAGVIELTDPQAKCAVDVAALDAEVGDGLRPGQVVDVEWAEPGEGRDAFRAVRVTPRDDLQATPGG